MSFFFLHTPHLTHPTRRKVSEKFAIVLFLSVMSLFYAGFLQAQPELSLTGVDGVCVSDCKIIATASNTTGSVRYALLDYPGAGQSTPLQTSNIFEGLDPGTYTVGVYDAVANIVPVRQQITVTTSYTQLHTNMPDVFANERAYLGWWHCADPGVTIPITGGHGPYKITLQNQDAPYNVIEKTFENVDDGYARIDTVPQGRYIIEIEDSCGQGIRIPSAAGTTFDVNPGIQISDTVFTDVDASFNINWDNCDSMRLDYDWFTYTYTVSTANNTCYNAFHFGYDFRMRVEYPAGSGNYTSWACFPWYPIYFKYDPSLPDGDKYRIQLEHPCTGAITASSTVYTIPPSNFTVEVTNGDHFCPKITARFDTHPDYACKNPYTYILKDGSTVICDTVTDYTSVDFKTDYKFQTGQTYTVELYDKDLSLLKTGSVTVNSDLITDIDIPFEISSDACNTMTLLFDSNLQPVTSISVSINGVAHQYIEVFEVDKVRFRIEYPAGSGTFTDWSHFSNEGNIGFVTAYDATQPNGKKYRIQIEHPCTGALTFSQEYTVPAAEDFCTGLSDYCGEIKVMVCPHPDNVCSGDVFIYVLKEGSNVITYCSQCQKAVFGAADGLQNGHTYDIEIYDRDSVYIKTFNNLTFSPVSLPNDILHYSYNRSYNHCSNNNAITVYSSYNLNNSYLTALLSLKSTEITPAISRDTLINILNNRITDLWSDLPFGKYEITADFLGLCTGETDTITIEKDVQDLIDYGYSNDVRYCNGNNNSVNAYLNYSCDSIMSVKFSIKSTGATPEIIRDTMTFVIGGCSGIWGLYSSLPSGEYEITADFYENCLVLKDTLIIPAHSTGIEVDTVYYAESAICGNYTIYGDAYFYRDNDTIDEAYNMRIVEGPASAGTDIWWGRHIYNPLSAGNLPSGTYKLRFYPANSSPDDPDICSVEHTITIPDYVRPLVNISLSGGITCSMAGNNATMTVTVTNVADISSFQYRYKVKDAPDNTYTAFQTSNIFHNVTSGEYTVQVQDNCGSTTTQDIQVFDGSDSFLTVSGTVRPDTACHGSKVRISTTSIGSIEWYEWYFYDTLTGDWLPLDTVHPGSSFYEINPVQDSHKGWYMSIISNGFCQLKDSVRIAEVLPEYCDTVKVNICEGETYVYNGVNYTAPVTVIDSLFTAFGCDSVTVFTLSVNPVFRDTIYADICTGDAYTFRGVDYGQTGIYSDTLTSVHGCDSILTLNLTVHPSYNDTVNVNICENESYTYRGTTFTQPVTVVDSLHSVFGCDSIVVFNLSVNPVYSDTVKVNICEGETYNYKGVDYTTSVTRIDSLHTAPGCDSVIVFKLTVNPVYRNTVYADICTGDTYTFRGVDYGQTGIYSDTLQSVHGCDSIFFLNLTVYPVYDDTLDASICNGDSYIFNGTTYTNSGVYTDTLHSVHGCDSIVTLKLTVVEPPSVVAMADTTICYGDEIELYLAHSDGEVQWSVPQLLFIPDVTQQYFVEAARPPCPAARDSVMVEVSEILYIEPPMLPPYRVNVAYSQQLTTNAEAPVFVLADGMLPSGIFLNALGEIYGTTTDIETAEFTVRVTAQSGCSTEKDYTLAREMFVPKAFTPNGDGVNDRFMRGYEVVIFDRLGIEMFRGNDGWDGTHKGKTVPADIYFYILKYRDPETGQAKTRTGYIGVEL